MPSGSSDSPSEEMSWESYETIWRERWMTHPQADPFSLTIYLQFHGRLWATPAQTSYLWIPSRKKSWEIIALLLFYDTKYLGDLFYSISNWYDNVSIYFLKGFLKKWEDYICCHITFIVFTKRYLISRDDIIFLLIFMARNLFSLICEGYDTYFSPSSLFPFLLGETNRVTAREAGITFWISTVTRISNFLQHKVTWSYLYTFIMYFQSISIFLSFGDDL